MTPSPAAYALICEYEGLRLSAYLCPAGVWTIGYGSTRGVKKGMTITQAQADARLKADVQVYAKAVNSMLRTGVTQGQFDALVSFAFNLGAGALEKSTLLRKINASDPSAVHEFAKWNKATVDGKMTVLPGLTRRRAAEARLFAS